jgi:glycosyltransferase involved in cell wall biosynthesis
LGEITKIYMKVLFLARSDIYAVSGGDTVQIENTAKELRKLGVEVDVSTNMKVDIKKYDLVHVFQLDWVPETYFYVREAKKYLKPIVLSPIHHAEYEVKKFDDIYTFGLRKVAGFFIRRQEHRDILKNFYRSLFDRSKFLPTIKGAYFGYRRSQKESLLLSDIVLVQTNKEAQDLQDTYGVNFTWEKVVNGVSQQFLEAREYNNKLDFSDYIICVGRIEARKNQLNIIEAVKLLREEGPYKDVRLVFLGRRSRHHRRYTSRFNAELKNNDWIIHPGYIPQEDIPSYFHFSKVGVSASWFETTGLTSLEALFCGSNVVVSGDRAKELLGNLAVYCDPSDVNSIKAAIAKAYARPLPQVPESFRKDYTWENAARRTFEIYERLLKGKKK